MTIKSTTKNETRHALLNFDLPLAEINSKVIQIKHYFRNELLRSDSMLLFVYRFGYYRGTVIIRQEFTHMLVVLGYLSWNI